MEIQKDLFKSVYEILILVFKNLDLILKVLGTLIQTTILYIHSKSQGAASCCLIHILCSQYLIYGVHLPPTSDGDIWKPYHFRWIRNMGTSIIKNVRYMIGNHAIQEYPVNIFDVLQNEISTNRRKKCLTS